MFVPFLLLWTFFLSENIVLHCKVCKAHPKVASGSSFIQGCSTFKSETLEKHLKSSAHCKAMLAENATRNPEETPIAAGIARMSAEMGEHLRVLFRTAFYIAKEEKPFSDFPGLCQLQALNGVNIQQQYVNDKACRTLLVP